MDLLDEIVTKYDLLLLVIGVFVYAYQKNREAKKTLMWLSFLNVRVHQLEAAMSYIDKHYLKADIPYSALSPSPETQEHYKYFADVYNIEELHLKDLYSMKKKR